MIRLTALKHMAAASCAILLASLAAHGQNVVMNPGFESGSLDPWQGQATVTNSVAHTGSHAAHLDGTATIDLGGIPAASVSEISFWLKGSEVYDPDTGAGFSAYSIGLLDPDRGFMPGAVPIRHTSLDWEMYGSAVSHHPGCFLMSIHVSGQGYLDDVTVIGGSERLAPGDADTDGDVDTDDFALLKQNFGTGFVWSEGDFDFDHDVDLDDFCILKNGLSAGHVPEPAAAALLGFGGVALRRRRRT